MSTVQCPGCKSNVVDQGICPNCNFDVKTYYRRLRKSKEKAPKTLQENIVTYEKGNLKNSEVQKGKLRLYAFSGLAVLVMGIGYSIYETVTWPYSASWFSILITILGAILFPLCFNEYMKNSPRKFKKRLQLAETNLDGYIKEYGIPFQFDEEKIQKAEEQHKQNMARQATRQSHHLLPRCPKCNSTAITAGQRGYKLMTGFLGSNKTVNRCANCGHSWSPEKK